MNKNYIHLILWLIFGFLFITAIDAIVYAFAHLIFYLAFYLEMSVDLITIIVPLLTLVGYAGIAFFLLIKLRSSFVKKGITEIGFPKRNLLLGSVLAIFLYPTTNKLTALASEKIAYESNLVDIGEFLAAYGYMNTGITVSQILILLVLFAVFLRKYKIYQTKPKHNNI